jgi:5-methylcytosine-specific restriction endonuclease McrA
MVMRRTPLNKKGKSPTAKLQKECDRLLQQCNKLLHNKCEVCGKDNEVGHHFVEKSRSSRLRYELTNIIPLCNSCHYKIHNRNGNMIMTSHDIVEDIINKRGKKWLEELNTMGREIVKTDVLWYENWRDKLEDIIFANTD